MTRPRRHYAWVVLGVTFLALLAGAGVRATPSVLIVPLEQEFGWSRSTISFAISVNILLYGLMGPFAGALMQRLGIRRTTIGALGLLAVGVALSTRVREPWQLVLTWGVIVGTGSGMVALVLGATVVNRWFSARRGLAMGLLTASTATGQLVFLPLLARIIESSGWRAAVFLVAGAAALTIPLVVLLLRERPAAVGLPPYGAREIEPAPTRRRVRLAWRFRRWPRGRARGISGSSSVRSSSAGRRPTDWSARISSPPRTTTAFPRCARRDCWR